MKLIILTVLVLKYAEYVTANQHYGFPPQFQKPNSGVFASDSSIYLPPESHTPVPYFSIKNSNNLPFPYLPPTGTKAPSVYPSPFPAILSSTLVPIFDDDDDVKEHNERNKLRMSSTPPSMPQMKRNVTNENNLQTLQSQQAQRREMRQIPKMTNYNNPIDRIDMRLPVRDFPSGPSTPNPINQTPRNMIISVDTHRNDRGMDQIRASSLQNPNYVPAPGFAFSSTTEPAIPILRLSNEMDLDGSFSYEALGADQTHYVQHSHMENMGTEKEEQVVEGSYSYVGDNGQTYTVHYIADSNGFRASGDHLPVAPPIPEIIQRAVQYNLAEEAKKPPHLRSWQVDEKEYDNSIDKNSNFAPPPPRNLFTGRTPEAFSYNFGQGSNDNNLAVAASSQVPVKSNSEFNVDQSRKFNGPISPQITFVASQGAHNPSLNNPQHQQSISRIFSNEKTMPQLINYDAGIKEAEQEANKGLWRWQYGINSNNANENPDKNTISRSFGEDDIMINFNEMTPEQYTKMLQSQLEPNAKDSASSQFKNNQQNNQNPINQPNNQMNQYQNSNENNYYLANYNYQPSVSTEASSTFTYSTSYPESSFTKESSTVTQTTLNNFNQNNYVSPNPSVTYSYDYSDNPDNIYESRRIKALHVETTTKPSYNMNLIPADNAEQRVSYNNIWSHAKDLQQHLQNEPKTITQVAPFHSPVMPQNVEFYEQKSEFKPIKPIEEYPHTTTTTSTTTTVLPLESTTEDLFRTNIFLKSLVTPKKSEHKNINQITEEPKKVVHNKVIAETKADKIIQYQPKPHNELKSLKNKKPMDLSDMINYINMKNYFESSKVKTKSNSFGYSNYDNRNEMRYLPVQYDQDDEQVEDYNVPAPKSNLRSGNSQEQDEFRGLSHLRNNLHSINQNQELRGMIKNYKVLQRNNHARHSDLDYQNRKELSSLSIKTHPGLPPLGRAGPSMKTYLPPTYV